MEEKSLLSTTGIAIELGITVGRVHQLLKEYPLEPDETKKDGRRLWAASRVTAWRAGHKKVGRPTKETANLDAAARLAAANSSRYAPDYTNYARAGAYMIGTLPQDTYPEATSTAEKAHLWLLEHQDTATNEEILGAYDYAVTDKEAPLPHSSLIEGTSQKVQELLAGRSIWDEHARKDSRISATLAFTTLKLGFQNSAWGRGTVPKNLYSTFMKATNQVITDTYNLYENTYKAYLLALCKHFNEATRKKLLEQLPEQTTPQLRALGILIKILCQDLVELEKLVRGGEAIGIADGWGTYEYSFTPDTTQYRVVFARAGHFRTHTWVAANEAVEMVDAQFLNTLKGAVDNQLFPSLVHASWAVDNVYQEQYPDEEKWWQQLGSLDNILPSEGIRNEFGTFTLSIWH